jgi:transposase
VSLQALRCLLWQNMPGAPGLPTSDRVVIDERAALLALIRPTGQARMLLRARIVVAAADGANNAGIARDLAVCADTVRKWPGRYARDRLAGLADAHRPGRPRRFSAVQRAQLTAIACELPATRGMPLSRWSSFELACEAIEAGIVVDISASTVRRWLAADAIKPWQYRSWIAPRAPDFAAKATVVLDLYARVFDGQPLGPGDYVLCADEKTSVQARCRCHPSLAPGKARMMRVEHEYQPSDKAMRRARDRNRELTVRSRLRLSVETVVGDINVFLRGWAQYFRYGHSTIRFGKIRNYALGTHSSLGFRELFGLPLCG